MLQLKKFEYISVSIHKKERDKTIWMIEDGKSDRFIEINVGRAKMNDALLGILNKLGNDGWSLSTQPLYYRMFMQRKCT